MRVFGDLAALRESMGSSAVWRRAADAIEQAPTMPDGVAFSRGDSLTGVVVAIAPEPLLVGHRCYRAVLATVSGTAQLRVAPVAELSVARGYDDLTDSSWHEGAGEPLTLTAGQIAVLELTQAWRIEHGDGRLLRLALAAQNA